MTTHTVRRGETLSSIAKTYSVDTNSIAKINGVTDVNHLSVNSVLTIPPTRNRHAPDAKLPETHPQGKLPEARERTITEEIEGAWAKGTRISIAWLDELLQRLRTREANESVQHEENVFVSLIDPDINIAGIAGMTMRRQRIAADNQVLNVS